jgi:hypothetical protein
MGAVVQAIKTGNINRTNKPGLISGWKWTWLEYDEGGGEVRDERRMSQEEPNKRKSGLLESMIVWKGYRSGAKGGISDARPASMGGKAARRGTGRAERIDGFLLEGIGRENGALVRVAYHSLGREEKKKWKGSEAGSKKRYIGIDWKARISGADRVEVIRDGKLKADEII